MQLHEAKQIADDVGALPTVPLAQLHEAHAKLARTLRNGGVRNSGRASARLERRLDRLTEELARRGDDGAIEARCAQHIAECAA